MAIFRDERDRHVFLSILREVLDRFGWVCLTYCLMDNHYHLVIKTPEPNLSRGMRQLNGLYVTRFNRRHGRTGPLLERRFGSVLVQENQHFLNVIRYVAFNPVAAGLCSHVDEWPWCGHREMLRPTATRLVDRRALLDLLGVPDARADDAYSALVAEPGDPLPRGAAVLGDPDFVERVLQGHAPSEDLARRNWDNSRPPLTAVLDESDPQTIVRAYRGYGYTLREIAEELGLHSSTVSRCLRRAENT